MIKMMMRAMLPAAAMLGLAWSGSAAALKIGDPAPKLQVASWVQGEPVKNFEKGKMYVVEFWATWCGPCKASIPHLNEMYQKFKDKGVVVIGQNCWENDESAVKPFVAKMGTNMTYRVALDDKSKEEKGAMAVTWMDAAGRDGIPSAFIVNKQGLIAWIGHPMEMTEQLWQDILADKYDVSKAAADYDKENAAQDQMRALAAKLSAAVQAGKWDEANSVVDEMAKANPDDTISPQATKMELLIRQKKYDEAYKIAAQLSDAHLDKAQLQNQLAWMLVARPDLEKRDTALALKIAERANKASGGNDPSVLDTLARAQFMNGKKDEAIATAQKAVDAANADQKEPLRASLKSYQDGKLPELGAE